MRNFKSFAGLLTLLAVTATIAGPACAQNAVPLLINYQGELRSPTTGEALPDGSHEMLFRIYDVQFGGTPLWEGTHCSLNDNPVEVSSGTFNVVLGSGDGNALDPSILSGADRWLEIRIGMETLDPRQRITSVAYSMVSEDSRLLGGKTSAAFADVDHVHRCSDITSGVFADARIEPAITRDSEMEAAIADHAAMADAHHTRYSDSEAVAAMGAKADTNPLNHDKTTSFTELTDTAADVQIPSSIARDSEIMPEVLADDGSGSGLNADLLDGKDSSQFAAAAHNHDNRYWTLIGNAGTSGFTHFLGTTDDEPLRLRVNSQTALRLVPGESPNIIGGSEDNSVTAGVVGATVSGGGGRGNPNRVTDNYGTVGGGRANRAGDGDDGDPADARSATVGGGSGNNARAEGATVAGGVSNHVAGMNATISGGSSNVAAGIGATVGGGSQNEASGKHATVPGGMLNSAQGAHSFAAGGRAKAIHDGTFVWADSTGADFASTAEDQFLVRASGGAHLQVGAPGLHVEGNAETTGDLTVGGSLIHPTLPIAYGVVRAAGTLASGTENVSSTWNAASLRYEITISGESYHCLQYATLVTLVGSCDPPRTAMTNSVSDKLLVYICDNSGDRVQCNFHFVTFKP